LNGSPAIVDKDGKVVKKAIEPEETDMYIEHSENATAFMLFFSDEDHPGKIQSLSEKTPNTCWDALKGIDSYADLGAASNVIGFFPWMNIYSYWKR
jgi:hypothetical protein